jgi:hypothetical protein
VHRFPRDQFMPLASVSDFTPASHCRCEISTSTPQRFAQIEYPVLPPTESSAAGARQGLRPRRGQSGTVNSASRGHGLTGKPVTESNQSLRTAAHVAAQLGDLRLMQ